MVIKFFMHTNARKPTEIQVMLATEDMGKEGGAMLKRPRENTAQLSCEWYVDCIHEL